ncbi:MAG: SDR family NAD(P)-dependent oxidoreductase [Rhodocyclaceae bacterium]|nr:SDR family NAD(P)-dependent oxidoreductase [Rhodocyclaceae bacterium]
MSKVFLITGASRGFGRHWAESALRAGHRVLATARQPESLAALVEAFGDAVLPVALDVTDRAACFAVAEQAASHFGRIDVLISNAGYGHFGFVEEITEAEARSQIETNLFGSLWIVQAVLPTMRAQQSGHIIQVSSIGGVIAFPNLGIYHASKWAVEGLCESLSQEVADFGIHVTLLEPGPFTTDWSQASAVRSAPLVDYDAVRAGFKARTQQFDRGNPAATGDAILQLVAMDEPPLRLMLGRMAWQVIEPAVAARLDTWKAFLDVANDAHER